VVAYKPVVKKLVGKQAMTLKVWDKICEKILLIMITEGIVAEHPKRFNELFRLINHYRVNGRISKPTFNEHLNHLIEQDLIKRTQLEKQRVIYYLNSKNPIISNATNSVGFIIKAEKGILKNFSDKKMTVPQFVEWISGFSTWTYLHKISYLLKANLTNDSEARFYHTLDFRAQSLYLANLLIRLQYIFVLQKDPEIKREIIEHLKKEIDEKAHKILRLSGFSDEDIDFTSNNS